MIVGAMAWLGLALALSAPSHERPFDVVDFPQFLPLLKAHSSPWAQLRAVAEFYASEGRMSLLAYAFLALKWNLFGDWVVGWQLVRLGQMLLAASLLYALLRQWGGSRLGAYCAATLVLCSPAASIAWIRLNMAEPLGLVLLLTMLLLATRTPRRLRGWRSFVILGALATATLLMKEMLVGTFPAVLWTYSAFDDEGNARTLTLDRRVWLAGLSLAIVSLLVLLPVAYIALAAPQAAYARHFGSALPTPVDSILSLVATLFLFPLSLDGASLFVLLGLGTYLVLIAVGSRAYLVTATDVRIARTRLWFGYLFPLCCVLAYSPWPTFKLLYAIPYLLGPAVVISAGVTGIQRELGRWAPSTGILFVLVFAPMFASALSYTRRVDSYLRLSLATVQLAARYPTGRPLAMAACDLPRELWRDIGSVLLHYGRSMAMSLPAIADVDCEQASRILGETSRDTSVIIITPTPGVVPAGATVIRMSAWTVTFPEMRPQWSEVAAIGLPASR